MFYAAIKLIVAAACLSFASYQDVKTREVDDKVWLLLGSAGALLTALEVLHSPNPYTYGLIALGSAAASFILGIALFYLGLAGGADAKCLWCIGLAFPWHPLKGWEAAWPIGSYLLLFPLSVFNNSVLLSLLAVAAIFAINVKRLLAGAPLFEGVEGESVGKKLALMFLGLKVDASRVLAGEYYRPLEVLEEGKRRVIISLAPRGEVPKSGEVWAMPVLPFVVNLSVGAAVAAVLGDLALQLASLLLSI